MHNTRIKRFKSLVKPLLALALMVALVFGQADSALAARGGRMGGGSFRSAPSRTYTSPARPAPGGGYYGGGGFGFPFLIPFFGFGGGFGGLFTIFMVIAVGNFLMSAVRRSQENATVEETYNPTMSVNKLQVALLADARTLQDDLNRIAESADTGSTAGLAQVLQETSLSLLRHPEYWVYGSSSSQQAKMDSAELQFNRLALTERSKFSEETLSNVNNQLRQASDRLALGAKGEIDPAKLPDQPGEYIVVTLITANQGKLDLPTIQSSQDLRRALSQMGAIAGDKLAALEVLWTPQAEGDTLSADELLAEYPDLRLV
ncbi:MAG: DUF1517 domain-containing protein [Synechococcales cyanobacterium K44_A2020_017]|nr:DUF1517 domain-containing protein [Synechococcales cyanobacterium K32_A2020_035]MBF2096514.1 DUF1517 domain-containing protein [Synechococcales cyanobacterium K44_A2020_017]